MSQSNKTGSNGQLSVVQLSRLQQHVVQLREHLRAALLADGPQLEMIVFTSLFDLYEHFYFNFFVVRAAASSAASVAAEANDASSSINTVSPFDSCVSAEARFVTSAYTQDLLAACLYLMDVDSLPSKCLISSQPPALGLAHNEDNASSVYVSKAQRHFCFLLFMYICWSDKSLPLKDVLHALYPLLDPGVPGSGTATATAAAASPEYSAVSTPAAENGIAADLFSQPRFASRKRLIGEILNGLVLSRSNGVLSLLRVLLLDDRVEADMTLEAAQLIVRLLTAPRTSIWTLSDSPMPPKPEDNTALDGTSAFRVMRDPSPSVETQVQRLAPQLLSLLEELAEDETGCENRDRGDKKQSGNIQSSVTAQAQRAVRQPRFLAQLESLHQRLPAETLRQRLHLFLTLLLNALVKVPPRRSADFPRCYRQFFYANKYILSPGFACLSLRSDGPFYKADVVAALRRLTSLAKGVALGAGTAAFSHVLPATAAGILNLCALQTLNGAVDLANTVRESDNEITTSLWCLLKPMLSNPSLHELTAHALVQACTSVQYHSFSYDNAVEHNLLYTTAPCSTAVLTQGFGWLLSVVPLAAPDFVHVAFEAMVDTTQLDLYASGVESLTAFPSARDKCSSSTSPDTNDAVALAEVIDASLSSSPALSLPPLVLLLERLCLEAPSEAIFGTPERLSLLPTVKVLGRLLGLSVVLYRWAVQMLNALLRSDSVRIMVLHGQLASTAPLQQQSPQQQHPSIKLLDAGQALEEHRRFLSHFVCACKVISSTLQMLNAHSNQHSDAGSQNTSAVVASLIIDDADLQELTSELNETLRSCITNALQQLDKCNSTTCELSSSLQDDNEVVVTVMAQWQRLWTQLQSALDGRSAIEVALTITCLSRSVDDVVHDVKDPQPLLPVVRPLLLTLTRVLYECDEVASAVRAVHCLTWLAMYRFDSVDSSFVADIVWAVLGEETLPAWLAAHVGYKHDKAPALLPRVCRLKTRLLDVLLALTDYDEDGRTLCNIDDVLRRTRYTPLYDVLVRLCHNTSDVLVQVATLHFIGSYALAVYPRVPLTAMCDLCRDIFRLTSHEMAKAACAAALGKVVAALYQPAGTSPSSATSLYYRSASATSQMLLPLVTEVDLETCQTLAAAMASYRGRPQADVALQSRGKTAAREASMQDAEVELHEAVIQQHGRDILQLLRSASLSWGQPDVEGTPSVLRVQKPTRRLP